MAQQRLVSDIAYYVTTPLTILAADARAAALHAVPALGRVLPTDGAESHPGWPLEYARAVAVSRNLLCIDRHRHSVERIRRIEAARDRFIASVDAAKHRTPATKAHQWTLAVDRRKLDSLERLHSGSIPDWAGVLGAPGELTWRVPEEIEEPTAEHAPRLPGRKPSEEIIRVACEYVPAPSDPSEEPGAKAPKLIVLLPGGGLAFGSATGVRPFARRLAALHRAPVLSLTYRKPPEYPFPAGVRDSACLLGFLTGSLPTELFDSSTTIPLQRAFKPEEVLLVGNSAGGGVLLSSLLYLRRFLPTPADSTSFLGSVLISPWLDLRCTGPSWELNGAKDILPPFLRNGVDGRIYGSSRNPVGGYLEGHGGARTGWHDGPMQPSSALLSHPLLSPALAPPDLLASLPPTLLHSGSREALLSDAAALHASPARTAWALQREMCHDFRMHDGTYVRAATEAERGWVEDLARGRAGVGKRVVEVTGEPAGAWEGWKVGQTGWQGSAALQAA
ncbi:Alpha/Beta hydrolase protein [Hyaloraphidium curvatum]|nr:Alpha/Beta hydrolase protein [Hyaloraphidium curvatum]